MKRIGGYIILSKKEERDIVMGISSLKGMLNMISCELEVGNLKGADIISTKGEVFERPTDHLVHMIKETIQESEEATKDLYWYGHLL